MKVSVDAKVCVGHGLCYLNAPAVFTPDDEGYAVVRDGEVPAEHAEDARTGAAACPERAIVLAE